MMLRRVTSLPLSFLLIPTVLIMAAFCSLDGCCSAEETAEEENSRISVFIDHLGRPVMLIDYHWKIHRNPSIEICRSNGEETPLTKRKPLNFRAHDFHGYVRRMVDHCLIEGATVPTYQAVEVQGIPMTIIGKRNYLERAAVSMVGVENLRGDLEDREEERREAITWAIFPLLSPWSVDSGKLCLTLPRTFFAQPQELRIWFLRGQYPLWEETIAWPGYSSPEKANDETSKNTEATKSSSSGDSGENGS
jgi:hypothetical protein